MVRFGVDMTHALDDLLGVRRKRTLADRDVPGLTRSLIPLLSESGVRAINIAPNAQMSPANVPPAFIWKDADAAQPQQAAGGSSFGVKDPSGKEMLTMFWDGWNYGIKGQPGLGCDMVCFQTYPGCDTAVYFDWIGEDSGPNVNSAADVLALYAKARARFPGAEVFAGGLDDIADALLQPAARAALPTLTGEIGDTWSYGIQSDPKKTRDLRLLMRHRTNYSKTHGAPPAPVPRAAGAPAVQPLPWWQNFSRLLLKGYEHTWGGLARPDAAAAGFINRNFHRNRSIGTTSTNWIKSLEETWTDQRTWAVDMSIDSIGDPALRAAIESERASIAQKEQAAPATAGLTRAKVGSAVAVGKFRLTVDAAGAISGLTDAQGREWAGRAGAALLWLRYSLGTNAQMAAYRETYCAGNIRAGDTHCGEGTYGKPGLQRNESVLANATVLGVWSGPDELHVEVGWPAELHVEAGAPKSTWLKASAGADGTSLELEVLLVNKTSTRQLESMFLTFAPDTPSSMRGSEDAVGEQCDWSMDKLGEWVDAKDIMKGGSGGISPVLSGVKCARTATEQMFVRSLDAGVVHWGSAGGVSGTDMLPVGGVTTPGSHAYWTQSEADVSTGAHFVLYDNLWNTKCALPHPCSRMCVVN
jgi:hypothetical protein